MSSLGL